MTSAELRRQLAQLLVVRGSGFSRDSQRRYPRWELTNAELKQLLELGVGGVILLGGSAEDLRLRCAQLQSWAQQTLLLCADVEEGVGQRFEGASWLVPPLALGRLYGADPARAVQLAERYGRCCGRQARRVGLNWVLGPVCDVNNNPANPVINVRAWGETPESAGALAAAFVRGCQSEGVLACAKHFPGHGDTSSDSHLELPLIPHSRDRLEAVELPPFRAAIAADVAAVMTAHLQLPALDSTHPATLSPAVLTGLLREDLGFQGLVVTDALVMEAITKAYGAAEAAVLAFEAGADLILMPADAAAALEGLAAAVESGRISEARVQASLERRVAALRRCPPQASEPLHTVLEQLSSLVSADEQALAVELLELSLERQGGSLPAAAAGVNLIRLDSQLNAPQLPAMAPALLRPAAQGYQAVLLDGRSPSPWSGNPDAPLALDRLGNGPVLLQLLVRGNPFRGSAGGDEPWPQVVRQLLEAGRLAALAVYGSPYLWEQLRPLLPPELPAAYSPGQMPQAQAVVLQALGLDADALEGGFSQGGFTD
ncbi:MAG: glycosyl hydrolase family 3 [Cyanobacteria bacterium M_surface_7_m2_037]|nr:glycosyl hydrolase family 3 [Cyanobacteria bacterium M_surface_7_m2_037]